MEDIVDLEGDLHYPSTQVPTEVEAEPGAGFLDTDSPSSRPAAHSRVRTKGRASGTRSLPGPDPTQSSVSHKIRGPN